MVGQLSITDWATIVSGAAVLVSFLGWLLRRFRRRPSVTLTDPASGAEIDPGRGIEFAGKFHDLGSDTIWLMGIFYGTPRTSYVTLGQASLSADTWNFALPPFVASPRARLRFAVVRATPAARSSLLDRAAGAVRHTDPLPADCVVVAEVVVVADV